MNKLLFLLSFITCVLSHAQIEFQEHLITTNADGARCVYSGDLDNDGDMDAISASSVDNTIAWYENTDGQGQFGPMQLISTNTDWASSVFAADLDGDQDIDILTASFFGNRISWHENLDGLGNFGDEIIISNETNGALSVIASDLDSDGDMDVIVASHYDDKISWFENTGGFCIFNSQNSNESCAFSSEKIITQNADGVYSIFASDLDADGDMDVVSSSYYDNKVAWYENADGQGNFGSQQILSTNANGAVSIFASDLDSDGDMDVISASRNDNKIAWYINMDSNGSFSSEKIITSNLFNVSSIYADDFDSDGDNDVIATSMSDNKVVIYINISAGSFGDEEVLVSNADGASSLFSVDLDGDNDKDILTSNYSSDQIVWLENLSPIAPLPDNSSKILSAQKPLNSILNSPSDRYISEAEISITPNPTYGNLNVQSKNSISEIKVYNQIGQLVLKTSNTSMIDISILNQGVYILKIKDENGTIGSKKVVRK